jgi:anti-sigma B factor antagonist
VFGYTCSANSRSGAGITAGARILNCAGIFLHLAPRFVHNCDGGLMSSKVTVRHSGNVAVVDLAGRITLGEGSGMVRSTIKDLVANGDKNVLLNLKDMTYMDSAGLGEVVGAYATVTNAGGNIKLLNPLGKIKELLHVTKLFTVFETFENEDDAVRSFGSVARA